MRTLTIRLMSIVFLATAGWACGDGSGGGPDADDDADGTGDVDHECEGCWIGGECLDDGDVNPANPCQECDPARSTGSWSDNDGAACEDDGTFCNGADSCEGGACAAHAGDPCTDDGIFCNGTESCNEILESCLHSEDACADDGTFCNGVETCDEESDSCGHAGDPCTEGECLEAENRCCIAGALVGCNSAGDAAWFDSCGHAGEVVEDCPDAPDVLCRAGVCGCMPGWSGAGCDVCVRFVDGAAGDDDALGTTWENAKATVQAGIDAAAATGCEVWVKTGTYLPSAIGSRDESFRLAPGVTLAGGFDGTEISPTERDLEANPTILSGDVGVAGTATDNSRTIIFGAEGAALDGLTISGGNFQSEWWFNIGTGGLYCDGVAMTVRRCVFEDNYGEYYGGAIWVEDAPITIEDSVFRGNSAGQFGGAIYIFRQEWGVTHTAGTAIRRSVFEGNSCTGTGDAMVPGGGAINYTHWQSPPGVPLEIESCVFAGNSSARKGGAVSAGDIWDETASISIRNSVFVGNHAGTEGGGLWVHTWTSTQITEVTNSIFWGNDATASLPQVNDVTALTYCDVQDAGFDGTDGNISIDPLFRQGDPDAGPLDLHLTAGSPCIDAGDDTVAPGGDIEGNPWFDDPLTPNCATAGEPECDWFSDIGAYEYQG